ncbi:MAG: hypothetical protein U0441_23050 [Polyangiaceae bacterium]
MAPDRLSWLRFASIVIALSSPLTASAEEPVAPMPPPPSATTDVVEPPPARPFEGVERPWLYSPDATAPRPGHVIATMNVGYADTTLGAGRPFAANLVHAGAVFGVGAEVGVLRFASIQAEGLLSGDGHSVSAGGMVGVTAYPFPTTWPVQMALSGGYLRELGGADGVWGRAVVAGDISRLRLSATALASHMFAPDRDAVDLLLSAGASVKVVSFLRLGAEYVVQDLEGLWEGEEEEAEGGARHFLSPMASLELGRVRLTAGPAFGLSPQSPRILGRLQAGYAF